MPRARAALIVATEELDAPFADALIDRLRRTDDAVLRAHVIRVLAHQTDRRIVERVWALILDPEIPKRDAAELLRRQGHRVANREVLFDRIVAHYDALLERLPHSHRAWLPWRVANFCDWHGRDRVEAFFAERVKPHQGGPRALVNVLEAIEICAAIAQAQRADAVGTLTAQE